jgi:preprotein translocase subunit SecY
MPKEYAITALIALAAFGIVAYVQKNVVEIPVVGKYLPTA